jgi:glutathione S-transferase
MTNLTLIIGNKNYSSWSLRPWLLMRHFKLPFNEQRVLLFTESTESDLAPYFSDSKVPVLVDGELTVWDSLAICEYISENHLDNKAWPEDSYARAIARSASAEMHSSFAHLRNEMPMNCRREISGITLSDKALHEVDRVKQIWRKCREEYGSDGRWLFGGFSIADAMFAPVVLRFQTYGVELDGLEYKYAQSLLAHPDVLCWLEAGRSETEIIAEDEL